MELIVGSDERELAVPGREFDVPGRASCWANGMGRAAEPLKPQASSLSSNKRGGAVSADPNADLLVSDQVIRENPANRGTETSAEVLVGPPGRME